MNPGDHECWKHIGVFGTGDCPELEKVTHCRNCPVFTAAGRQLMERAAPEGYRAEWTTRLALPKPSTERDHSVIVFRVAEEWFALDTSLFVEVAPWRQPHRMAHRPAAILGGLVNLRGQLHLCVYLRGLLQVGAPTPPDRTARLLVVARAGVVWALVADEVHGVHLFARNTIENAPAATSDGMSSHARGVLRWNGRPVGYLDGEAVFSALTKAIG